MIIICIVSHIIILFTLWKILILVVSQFSTEWTWSLFWSHLFWFWLLLFIVIPLIFRVIKNYFLQLLSFPFDIFYINERSIKWKIFSDKIEKISLWNIKEIFSLFAFYKKIYTNSDYKISEKEVVYHISYKKFFSKIQNLNSILENHICKGSYISTFDEIDESFYKIKICRNSETTKKMKEKIFDNQEEILWIFAKNNFSPALKIKSDNENFYISIFNQDKLWENQNFDKNFLKNLKKWEILLWFSPNKNNWFTLEHTSIFASELAHSIVVWATRSWKDIFINNFILSILYNIKNFSNSELYFFDTKTSDGIYLEGLMSFWIFRYKNYQKYVQILEKLENEMYKIQEIIWIHSNIENYNSHNPNNPLKYKFIIINEFLSLSEKLDSSEFANLMKFLISMMSQGASAGYKFILLTQTIRADLGKDFQKILLNTKTRFVLRLNTNNEINIITNWMDDNIKNSVKNISNFRTICIQENKFKTEFKGYFLTQDELKNWVEENFEMKNEDIEISNLSEKVQKYITYSRSKNDIDKQQAIQMFGLSESEWKEFIYFWETNNLIIKEKGKKIIWK